MFTNFFLSNEGLYYQSLIISTLVFISMLAPLFTKKDKNETVNNLYTWIALVYSIILWVIAQRGFNKIS
jgi:hypothetical protein